MILGSEQAPEQNRTVRTVALFASPDGSEPALSAEVAAAYRDGLGAETTGWVYLGHRMVGGLPQSGNRISVSKDAVLRNAPPARMSAGEAYVLGSVNDVLSAGETIEVKDLRQAGEEGLY